MLTRAMINASTDICTSVFTCMTGSVFINNIMPCLYTCHVHICFWGLDFDF